MTPPYAAAALLFLLISGVSFVQPVHSELSQQPMCLRESAAFVCSLNHKCPFSISPNPLIQVDGIFLDRLLETNHHSRYTSIIFYASWCPFSQTTYSAYEALSSMFPQIDHLTVDHSSVMPSVFSRYGVHSLPTIFLVNKTSVVRYHGPKTLISLTQFYKKITGIEPVQFMLNQPISVPPQINEAPIKQLINGGLSMKEMAAKEPYLVFAVLFICLRVIWAILPKIISHAKAFWISYVPHLNLGIFGEASHVLGRVVHVFDIRSLWTKLRLSKTRNFHERARHAKVWASSSFASVSLGECSTS